MKLHTWADFNNISLDNIFFINCNFVAYAETPLPLRKILSQTYLPSLSFKKKSVKLFMGLHETISFQFAFLSHCIIAWHAEPVHFLNIFMQFFASRFQPKFSCIKVTLWNLVFNQSIAVITAYFKHLVLCKHYSDKNDSYMKCMLK